MKEKHENYTDIITNIENEMEILTVNKNDASLEINDDTEAAEIYHESCELLKKLEEEKKAYKGLLKANATLLASERKKRLGNENGIENLLFDILETSRIKKQSFHGGAINRVSCRCLLDRIDDIFPKIRLMAHKRVNANSCRSKPIDHSYLDEVLD